MTAYACTSCAHGFDEDITVLKENTQNAIDHGDKRSPGDDYCGRCCVFHVENGKCEKRVLEGGLWREEGKACLCTW